MFFFFFFFLKKFFQEYILNDFRDVEHKSTSLMVLKNDRAGTIDVDGVMILFLWISSDEIFIYTKFYENILDCISYAADSSFIGKISEEHNSMKI